MSWVAVAVAGAGVLGAGASYAGSKKQGDAAKQGAGLQMDQFRYLNQQQQPFIRSGYGAMGKLNTLLGIGGGQGGYGARTPQGPPPGLTVNNGPGGPGVQIPRRLPMPVGRGMSSPKSNPRLQQLLALRAQNGDTEAARIMGLM